MLISQKVFGTSKLHSSMQRIDMHNPSSEPTQPGCHYLDPSHILELVAGDAVLVHSLLSIYLQSSPDEIASLGQAIETSNRRDMACRAHRLRGSLRYLGAQDLEDMLYEIEAASGTGEQQELLAGYKLFQGAARQLEQEIRTWLVSLSAPALRP